MIAGESWRWAEVADAILPFSGVGGGRSHSQWVRAFSRLMMGGGLICWWR